LISHYPPFDHKVPATDGAQAFVSKKLEIHLGDKLGGQHVVARMETDFKSGKSILSFQPQILPRIDGMSFAGASELTPAELNDMLQKVVGDQGYLERRFREAVELNLRRAYEQRGMYRVKFSGVTIQKTSASSVSVTTTIEEGAKYTLGDVQLAGDALPAEAMFKAAKFRKGAIANWTEIQTGIWEMEKPLKRTGYFDARARPEQDSQRVWCWKCPMRKWAQVSGRYRKWGRYCPADCREILLEDWPLLASYERSPYHLSPTIYRLLSGPRPLRHAD